MMPNRPNQPNPPGDPEPGRHHPESATNDNEGLQVDLSAAVGQFVLQCRFDVPEGASLAVVGPNGSGKSTLLRSLAGLVSPDEGHVVILGHTAVDTDKGIALPPERRNIALAPQKPLLFPHLTVAGNVRFGLNYRLQPTDGVAHSTAISDDQAVAHVLRDVGLARFQDRKPSELSGGQQQRAGLARALVVQPNLLLADEPLSNIDADSRHELRVAMEKWRPAGQIQVIVTHGRDHSQAADLVLALEAGRVVAFGPPGRLRTETKLVWLRDLLNASD